ncbi:MAG TPA: hypothetical protein ENI34_04855 [candidate division WOR-3 bacterium]|uniref:peptidylprolyl isomerase n=1 Tax=candidate division WOR-3 bacterium TaxID=2052148 RepID=A0A9C9EMM5_UNCW3|nr:hypothetical protein [candidate division WOR-3 bacterium]
MNLILLLFMALPQDYINLIMEQKYDEALQYCEEMISRGRDTYKWEIERADIYLDKLQDYDEAVKLYKELTEKYQKKDGWLYYRLALACELNENYLDAAKAYEVVATKYRKAPLDSFALNGVERCFKKNYQEYVALVNGYKITRLELDEELGKRSPFARKDEKAMLDQMILQRLLYENALNYGIPKTELFKEEMSNSRRSLLLDEVYATEVIEKSKPSEKDMKKYYYKNRKNYMIREQVRGKEIVVESDSLAQFLLDSLKKDIASFDSLAKLYSTARSKASGGNMGIVYKGVRPKPVDKALFKAELNKVIGVIPFDDKFGIYIVTDHKPKRYRKFEEVKNQIETALKAENLKKVEKKFLKKLRKRAKIKIYSKKVENDSILSEDRVVAVVNGREILYKDVEVRNASQPQFAKTDLSREEEFKKLLDKMIDDELKLEFGERHKYFLNDGYIAKLKDARKRLMESGLYRKVVVEAVSVDSQEVKDFYKEHKEDFKIPEIVRCKEIVVDSLPLAEELRTILKQTPEKFDSLAREHSKAPTAKRGGVTGTIRRGMKPKKYEEIAFKLEPGEISKVFSADDSTYTILTVVEHNPASYRTFEEVKKSIETNLLRQKQRDVANEFIEKIKAEAKIEIFLSEEKPKEETKKEDEEKKENK